MPFLTGPALYIIVVLLCTNLLAGVGYLLKSASAEEYKAQVSECKATHAAFVAQTESQGKLAAQKARNKEAENAKVAKETSDGWAAAIAAVRADYAKRLRLAASRDSGGSGVSAPAQDRPGDAQASPDTVPSPARVAADCAETTITLNYLQSYVERLQNE